MEINYRNIKYPRLEFRTGKLIFILPFGTNPEPLQKKYSRWIISKEDFIEDALKKKKDKKLEKRDITSFKKIVAIQVVTFSKELGVRVNKIIYRDMRSKWGSCSKAGNLTFNINLKYLPLNLIRYVIFHEISHIISRKHNLKFWNTIELKFKNHQNLEAELFTYWFLIKQKEKTNK